MFRETPLFDNGLKFGFITEGITKGMDFKDPL